MGSYNEIEGDLIDETLEGSFDVIAHGVNCFCTMGAGIAPIMAENFGCDTFRLEGSKFRGSILKLGQIDYEGKMLLNGEVHAPLADQTPNLYIVNAYTQYGFATKGAPALNYPALALCLTKINHLFKGKRVGLPYVIGCGLAGGDPDSVIDLIKKYLIDMDVTMVRLPQNSIRKSLEMSY